MHRAQLICTLLVLFPYALLVATPAEAQHASVSGSITDQQGAVVPNAVVTISDLAANIHRQGTTDETGQYRISGLAPGHYQLHVESAGFNPFTNDDIHLSEDQDLVLSAQLVVAAERTEVTVQSLATQIELENAAVSGSLTQKEVTSLGLNGRNFTQLITLTPGVSNQTGQDEAKVGVAGSAKFSVNGGRVEYNTFEVDGSDVLNTSINASRGQAEPLMVYPSVDAIQEIQVLTSNYGAMYGKSASGSVIVSTKSGTNAFHGNTYEFIRNEAFNARNYFDQTKRAPLYRRQDFGGTLGGPIYIPGRYNLQKDKTFFFFSEEARLEKTPVQYNQGVPSVAERNGDFTDACPTSTTSFALVSYPDCPAEAANPGTPPTQKAFAAVGQQQVSPTAKSLLNTGVIPLPNSSAGCNSTISSCYDATVSPSTYWREELFRIDHNVTQTEQLSFRYIHDTWNTTVLTPQWGLVKNSFPTVRNNLNGPGLDLLLALTESLPHSFLNRIAISYAAAHISLQTVAGPGVDLSRADAGLGSPCHTIDYKTFNDKYGIKQAPGTLCPLGELFGGGGSVKNLIPGLEFNGSNPAYGGHGFAVDTGYAPWSDANPTYMLRDDVSKVWGKHTLQFGGQLIVAQENELSGVNGANSGDTQGLLTFSNQISPRTDNNAFSDFLGNVQLNAYPTPSAYELGVNNLQSFSQDSAQARYYNRYRSAEFYLQDGWKITPHLALNLGFRASLFGTWYNAKDNAFNWESKAFSPSIASSIYVNPSLGVLSSRYTNQAIPLDPSNLDPALTNGLVQCGKNGVPRSCMQDSMFHPGPRVGFAWDVFGDGKTSLRGGYGIFWEQGTGSEANVGSLIGSAPIVLSETAVYGGAGVPGFDCIGGGVSGGQLSSNPDCNLDGAAQTASGTYAPAAFPINVTSVPNKAVYSYIQQWSMSAQRSIGKDLIASVAYVGTKGVHLTATLNLNQLPPVAQQNNPFGLHQPIDTQVCHPSESYPSGPGVYLPANPSQPFYVNLVVACYGSIGYGTHAAGLISPNYYRPYQGFNQISAIRNVADSQYHALQMTLRQTVGTLDLGVAYTYAHSIDDSSDRFNANFVNSYDLSQSKASSDFDQRHILNISYIYTLAIVKSLRRLVDWNRNDPTDQLATVETPSGPLVRNWLDTTLTKTLLEDWQISGITAYQTGTPFSAVNAGGSNGIGAQDNAGVAYGVSAGSYPDVVGNARAPKPAHGRNLQSFGPLLLNPAAFAAPRGLTLGNAGRNYLNNPSLLNFNMALLKHFKVFGERDLEFRSEAFNVFNHTQFRIYDPSHPGNAGNNVINCYGGPNANYSAAGGDGADCISGNSFLHPVDAHDPRILQFGLKLAF